MSATSSQRGYTPDKGSTAWKVIEYLTTNRSESLTSAAIEAKFEKPAKQVHSLLAAAVSAGVLIRKEDLNEGELVYKLGRGHAEIKANPGGAPSLGAKLVDEVQRVWQPQPAAKGRRARIVLDVASLTLEDGIPIPPKESKPRMTDWPALFARMSPSQAVTVPEVVKATLKKAITLQHEQHPDTEFTTRMLDGGCIRVWRVK